MGKKSLKRALKDYYHILDHYHFAHSLYYAQIVLKYGL